MDTKKKDLFTVQITDNMRTAMEKITANKHRAVVVLDSDTVVGTVSDGDLRRAQLKEVLPIAPVGEIMNLNCVLTTETDSGTLESLIKEKQVTLLPVVDAKNQLLDIALAYEPFATDAE